MLIKARHVHKRSMSEIIWRGIFFSTRRNDTLTYRIQPPVRNAGTREKYRRTAVEARDVPQTQGKSATAPTEGGSRFICAGYFFYTVGILAGAHELHSPRPVRISSTRGVCWCPARRGSTARPVTQTTSRVHNSPAQS